jgi:predicted ATPase
VAAGGFVGREAELERLRDLLARERLVTITGGPGMGKSRLAAQLCTRAEVATFLVDVREAAAAEDVCRTLASRVGLHRGGDGGPPALGRRLAQLGPALVVLDDCDRLLSEVAALVEEWLRAAREVRFLVTSRTALQASSEHAFELAPLPLPEPGGDPLSADAVKLVVSCMERAGLHPRAGDAEVLGAIARELDGIPLALELAAGRMLVLSPGQLLARLERRFELLRRPPRARDRHETLRAAIDWSWNMLEPAEQGALMQCAVFRGGFTVDAAEAVLLLPGEVAVLDALGALRDRSLVSSPAAGRLDAPRRLDLFRSIREYALEKLRESGEADAALDRHAAYFAALAGERLPGLDGPGGVTVRGLFSDEHDNLRAAFEHALRRTPPALEQAHPLALALEAVLAAHGPVRQRLEVIDRALGYPHGAEPLLVARLLAARANALRRAGRGREGLAGLETALRIARDQGDPALEGRLWTDRGVHYNLEQRGGDAVASLERALALLQRSGDRAGEGHARIQLAYILLEEGRPDDALEQADGAMAVFRGLDDGRGLGWATYCRGLVHQDRARLDRAESDYRRAIELIDRSGDRAYLSGALCALGITLQERGDHAGARAALEQAERGGALDAWTYALVLAHLGGVAATTGDLEEARRRLDGAAAARHGSDVPHLDLACDLQRALLELAEARSPEEPAPLRALVIERMARARAPGEGGKSAADRSLDVRVSLRILEHALARGRAPARGPLVVQRDGLWFTLPDGSAVSCARRREPVRRVLSHLAQKRLSSPGQAVPSDELLAVAWPGERMLRDAGLNRLYVAIASLRKLGLRDLLLASSGGYLLDPAVTVRLADGRAPRDAKAP